MNQEEKTNNGERQKSPNIQLTLSPEKENQTKGTEPTQREYFKKNLLMILPTFLKRTKCTWEHQPEQPMPRYCDKISRLLRKMKKKKSFECLSKKNKILLKRKIHDQNWQANPKARSTPVPRLWFWNIISKEKNCWLEFNFQEWQNSMSQTRLPQVTTGDSVFSAQFHCEPKTLLKNKVLFLMPCKTASNMWNT